MYTIMIDKNETINLEFKRTKEGEKNSVKIDQGLNEMDGFDTTNNQ